MEKDRIVAPLKDDVQLTIFWHPLQTAWQGTTRSIPFYTITYLYVSPPGCARTELHIFVFIASQLHLPISFSTFNSFHEMCLFPTSQSYLKHRLTAGIQKKNKIIINGIQFIIQSNPFEFVSLALQKLRIISTKTLISFLPIKSPWPVISTVLQ